MCHHLKQSWDYKRPGADDPFFFYSSATFVQLPYSQMVKISLKSFLQGSHASWKVLDFFLENSRTWKVLEKSWIFCQQKSGNPVSVSASWYGSPSISNQILIVTYPTTHPTPPIRLSKFINLSCRQTNIQRQKLNLLGRGKKNVTLC